MAKLKKYLPILFIILIPLIFWSIIVYDIIPPIIWSWQGFVNPDYFKELENEWSKKSSDFLIYKLYSIDSMRFGLASYILGQRKEKKAMKILIKKIKSNYIDNQIHFSACSALAEISPSIAKEVLTEVMGKYKNIRDSDSTHFSKYIHALGILAMMRDERVYPTCLKMAKSTDILERESSLNGMLYYFDNHAEEILPLYTDYLKTRESPKGQIIKAIASIKRPEVIPVLEDFASKNKSYEKDAQNAILYLKGLQK